MRSDQATTDHRFMAAAIRYARRHEGWTATNPSVACLIVKDGVIVGRGVTAIGGRPHAEPLALAQAGERAGGATAYVTLEPCAHHGRTPPCAQTLISAGVSRVVTAVVDPDERVNEKGHAMLRAAGIAVTAGVLEGGAGLGLAAYLTHKRLGRPFVTLKLAVSADGLIGLRDQGQIAITGPIARAQAHLMRARHQAILAGIGTVIADDPELTCRLPGLQARSPVRVLLDPGGRLHPGLKLVATAAQAPILAVSMPSLANERELKAQGVDFIACELVDGRVALPELLDDLGARGIMNILVEGGAEVARSFLSEDLVDALAIFSSRKQVGAGLPASRHIASPVTAEAVPDLFELTGSWQFGEDRLQTFVRRR